MNKNRLKAFAPRTRNKLLEQISAKALRYGIDFKKGTISETDSVEVRAKARQIGELRQEIARTSFDETLEKVAYTWFNRFIAIRFMEVNGYLRTRPLSSSEGHITPDILAEAQSGTLDPSLNIDSARLRELLGANELESAYQMLLVALFNQLNESMPYMFEKIDDYTELLMPDNLLSQSSVIRDIVEEVDEEDWKDVQIIGWLYQFYISDKKAEVDANVKRGRKVTEAELSPKTALFTPHWIVRYMVENSLGKLWLANHPDSGLREHMRYYIETDEPLENFPKIDSPEEITFLDPCSGSGHILVYAFDLLMKIYEERMYDTRDAVTHILTKNLYGFEIDGRSAALANYALAMRAMHYYPKFLRRLKITPNVFAIENLTIDEETLREYAGKVGHDLFTADLVENLETFRHGRTFGSLIVPTVAGADDIAQRLDGMNFNDDLFMRDAHEEVKALVRQMGYLQKQYTCTVTNPPYLGKGMNEDLKSFVKKHYPDSKSDLFACFMERSLDFTVDGGLMGMINQHSWMFLSSYEKLRKKIIENHKIDTLVHLGPRTFEEISGEVVQSVAFVLQKGK